MNLDNDMFHFLLFVTTFFHTQNLDVFFQGGISSSDRVTQDFLETLKFLMNIFEGIF